MTDNFSGGLRTVSKERKLLAVEDRIGIITNPVPQIDIPATGISQAVVDRQMTVPEDHEVEILALQDFLAIDDQPFPVLAEETLVDLPGDRPAAAAKPGCE